MPALTDPISRYNADVYAYEALDLVAGSAGVITIDGISNTDDAFAAVDLGTSTFRFRGQSFSGSASLYVSSNGLIGLGGAWWWLDSPWNSPLGPDPGSGSIVLAPLWDNWVTSRNGSPDDLVLYRFRDLNADGIQDQLIIEWNNVDHYDVSSSPDGMTFQAILGLNSGTTEGDIIFNYVDLNNNQGTGDSYMDNGGSATVGIRSADFALNVGSDGTFGLPVQSGTAIRFTSLPNAPTISINLVRDINSYSKTSNPGWLTTHNGAVYLSADDGVNGSEIWKVDSLGNASLLKNIRTDTYDNTYNYGSDPNYLTSVGSLLYFFAYDQVNGWSLWKSDGSSSGTTRVKSMPYGPDSNPVWQEVAVSNGKLFFNAYNDTSGRELWVSDGTEAGTTMVKDIYAGGGGADPWELTDVNGKLFFNAYQPTTGWELWKSDGTAAGTSLVKNIAPSTDNSDIRQLTNVNGLLYFTANTGSSGRELWKSDGTLLGTVIVRDLYGGANSSDPQNLTSHNGLLYFFANNGSGWRLYQSNGAPAGTVPVSTQVFSPTDAGSFNLTVVAGQLLFTNYNYGTNRAELWRSNGTSAGTTLITELAGSGIIHDFRVVNGALYFAYNDGVNGDELWTSNGTVAGTGLVKDIRAGVESSTPRSLTGLGSTLYFISNSDGPSGGGTSELWKSDGSSAGTTSANLNPTTFGSDINLNALGSEYDQFASPLLWQNKLYYFADDGVNGRELWSSDGSTAGTKILKDINPNPAAGSASSAHSNLTVSNGKLYFFAQDGTSGSDQLWVSDGSAAGTSLVKDLGFSWGGATLKMLDLNGRLIFQGYDGTNGWELWTSDGTQAGTGLLKDINPGPGWGSTWPLTRIGNQVFFSADDGTRGRELWKTDGTPGGTTLVRNIAAGAAGSDPSDMFDFNGTLYFSANDGVFGRELWKSDGTPAGTRRVKDIQPGGDSWPANFTAFNGLMFFTASNSFGHEIWQTDGSTKGTLRVTDQSFGTLSDLKVVGNSLYFVNDHAQLWKTDGTNAGTLLVANHLGGTNPTGLSDVNGVLFYSVDDRVHGRELWTSDGTPEGTRMVNDLNPYGSSNPRNLNYDPVKNTLYLLADNGRSGQELFSINRNEAPTDISLTPGKTAENVPASTNVGALTSTDRNAFDTFTYSLVAGAGSSDNALFSISGNQLLLNTSPDFETKSSYAVRIRSTDQGGLSTDKAFSVLINNINEAPTDLSLSNSNINENIGPTALVGNLSSLDPDSNQTFSYNLVAGPGVTDNAAFSIFANQLYLKANPDFEAQSTYSIRIETRDGDGLTYQKPLTITVNNQNDSPTDIGLSNAISNENVPINTIIGNLSTTDQDAGNTFIYSLAAGLGDADNGSFNINGNTLRFSVSPDFESKSSYSLRLRSTDQSGSYTEKSFAVTVNNLDNVVIGTSGADTLSATPEFDSIQSLDGDDTMNIAIGNLQNGELFDGGSGTDSLNISGGSATQTLTLRLASLNQFFSITNAAFSSSTIRGFENVSLAGFIGNSSITGNSGANRLTGSALNDVLIGGDGADTISGGSGDDLLRGDAGNDSLNGGGGTDTADYSTSPAGVSGNFTTGLVQDGYGATDTLSGFENLTGSAFADVLIGSTAVNKISGGLGADDITGGLGNDILLLGTDTAIDTVNYNSGDGSDAISNFVRGAAGDRLRFSGINSIDVRISGTATQFRVGDGIPGNAGFGKGTLLMTTTGTTGFNAGDVGVNLFNLTNPGASAFAFS